MKSIAVLMTCHNRLELTLNCINALFKNSNLNNIKLDVFLVDDGSTDGTSDAIKNNYPEVNLIHGDGNLYWNRGMHLAFKTAMEIDFDGYLWLNDDTVLFPNAIDELLKTCLADKETIVVGAICDSQTKEYTYGGARYIDPIFRPFLCKIVVPNGEPQEVDVMNGNVVLIPNSIANKLGNLDPVFEHGMGDTDYSMRARKLGITILTTPSFIGTCSVNPTQGTYQDKNISLYKRLKQLFSKKGQPWRSWLVMCWRHGGWLWPIHFIWCYIKIIIGRS